MDTIFKALINQLGVVPVSAKRRWKALRGVPNPVPLALVLEDSLFELLSIIHYMPYSWRKFCLSACRIQSNIHMNASLQQAYYTLVNLGEEVAIPAAFRKRRGHEQRQPLNITYVADLINEVITSPVQASTLSYFVRAEIPLNLKEFLDAGEESKLKELRASQLPDRTQQLDYTCLFTSGEMGFVGIHSDIPTFGIPGAVPTRLIRTFRTGLAALVASIESHRTIAFPSYNDRKTVSKETQSLDRT
jgi:hypothetical protein